MSRLRWGGWFLAAIGGLAVTAPGPAAAQEQKHSREVLTSEEIVQTGQQQDLYQAIRSLRPHFLRPVRGSRSITGGGQATVPVLYVDGMKSGDVEGLRSIRAQAVKEVRYLSPSQAGIRYGLGHEAGAILVTLLRDAAKPGAPPPG